LRQRLRRCFEDGTPPERLASEFGLDRTLMRGLLDGKRFGAAWADIEAASPALGRRRVAVEDVAEQMASAAAICDRLRAAQGSPPAADMARGGQDGALVL
jgi:hypothetical protein